MNDTYPRPGTFEKFEVLCKKVFQRYLGASDLKLFGRNGQAQYGIDLLGHRDSNNDLVAVQCKLSNRDPLTVGELESDVRKAHEWKCAKDLTHYLHVTTSPRDTAIQEMAVELQKESLNGGLFRIEVFSWDDLEEFFDENTDLRDEQFGAVSAKTVAEFRGSIRRVERNSDSMMAALIQDPDEQIRECAKLIGMGNAYGAEALVKNIREKRWGMLSKKQKAKVCEVHGHALILRDAFEDGARQFVAGGEYADGDKAVTALQALGHLNLGETEAARELAEKVLAKSPEIVRAQIVHIRLSEEGSVHDIELSIPESIRSNAEVALALAFAAFDRQEFSEGIRHARQTVMEAPEWAAGRSVLASLLCANEVQTIRSTAVGKPGAIDNGQLRESAKLLDGLLAEPVSVQSKSALATDYFTRGNVRRLRGNSTGASEDLARANELDPENPEIAGVYASSLGSNGNTVRAVAILEAVPSEKMGGSQGALLCTLLANRSQEGDLDRAIDLADELLQGVSSEEDLWFEIAFLKLRLVNRKAGDSAVVDVLGGWEQDGLDKLTLGTLGGMWAVECGDTSGLDRFADRCISAGVDPKRPILSESAAEVLMDAERWREALGFWKTIIPGDIIGTGTVSMMACAQRTGSASARKFILDQCGLYRDRGLRDERLLRMEVGVLSELNEWDMALKVTEDFVKEKPESSSVKVLRCMVAKRCGRGDIVSELIDELPQVADVGSPGDGFSVAMLLGESGRLEAAVEFAYQLYRRFRSDHEAQAALVACCFMPNKVCAVKDGGAEVVQPETVDVGCAVTVSKGDSQETLFIEERTPKPEHGEYAPGHPLARVLIGRRVGDDFIHPGGGERQGRILVVMPLELYHARRCAQRWEMQFPDQPFVWSYQMSEPKEGQSPSLNDVFRDALPQLRRQEERQQNVEETYSENALPVAWLAKALGKGTIESTWYLATAPELSIRTVVSNKAAFEAGAEQVALAKSVVLDGVAIGTLAHMGALQILRECPFRCVIPKILVVQVEAMLRDRRRGAQEGVDQLRVMSVDGEAKLNRISAADAERQVEMLEELLGVLNECEQVGGMAVLDLTDELAHLCDKRIEQSTTHAIAHAVVNDIPLWSDDGMLEILPFGERKLRRVWTHVVVGWLHANKHSEAVEPEQLGVRLALSGYEFTLVSAVSSIRAIRERAWDLGDADVRQLLGRCARADFPSEFVAMNGFRLLQHMWSELILPANVVGITHYVLECIGSRLDAPLVLSGIIKHIRGGSTISSPRTAQLEKVLRDWLTAR